MDINEIGVGQNWEKAVLKGLRGASIVLCVVSNKSVRSAFIHEELRASANYKIPVIPLIIGDTSEPYFPQAYSDFFPINEKYLTIDFRHAYKTAFETLLHALESYRQKGPVSVTKNKIKGYVFLSYAEEDVSFVDGLKKFMASRGYAYWDYRESERDYHKDLYLELEGVISEAEATLSILSPEWKRSSIAIKEYHFSNEVNTPVFLVKARELGPTLVISGLPFIDFTKDSSAGFEKLGKELSRKGL